MPGLSSSTLNLKFMQRGAARTPTSTPSTPVSKPVAGGSSPRPGPSDTGSTTIVAPETPSIEEPQLVASEEPYRWSLSRPTQAKPIAQPSSRVRFETSYLPFIDQSHRDDSPEAGPSRGGGGRMVFGYKEPEQEDIEKDEPMDEDADEDGEVVINVKKEREKGKREYKKPRPMMNEKGFMRPRSRSRSPESKNRGERGSLIPTKPRHGVNEKDGHGAKDQRRGNTNSNSNHHDRSTSKRSDSRIEDTSSRVKVERTSPAPHSKSKSNGASQSSSKSNGNRNETESNNRKRKPSQSTPTDSRSKFNINNTGTGSGTISEKKPKLSSGPSGPSLLNDYPTQATQPSQSGTTSIDQREAALKAQKKKEKNARKKARKSAE